MPNGIGIKFTKSKEIETGYFLNGKLEGFGRKIIPNGDVLFVNFKRGINIGNGYVFDYFRKIWYKYKRDYIKINKVNKKSKDYDRICFNFNSFIKFLPNLIKYNKIINNDMILFNE